MEELLEGDSNTKFFHAKANDGRRNNKITCLEQEEGRIEGDREIIDYITKYYKEL